MMSYANRSCELIASYQGSCMSLCTFRDCDSWIQGVSLNNSLTVDMNGQLPVLPINVHLVAATSS